VGRGSVPGSEKSENSKWSFFYGTFLAEERQKKRQKSGKVGACGAFGTFRASFVKIGTSLPFSLHNSEAQVCAE
jgi:hypothetical protein